MYLKGKDIQELEKIYRLNLINSVTGIKPANLIGTLDNQGRTNLAVFSSVVHLGSNPPLIGFITRPVDEVPRHTFENIEANGIYTINSFLVNDAMKAHYTSAKFESGESEFDACGFTPEFVAGFDAPFLKESPLKMGLNLVEKIPIERNGTILMIGQIEHLLVDEKGLSDEGYLDLENLGLTGISGLNSYYSLEKIGQYPYARVEESPKF